MRKVSHMCLLVRTYLIFCLSSPFICPFEFSWLSFIGLSSCAASGGGSPTSDGLFLIMTQHRMHTARFIMDRISNDQRQPTPLMSSAMGVVPIREPSVISMELIPTMRAKCLLLNQSITSLSKFT